MYSQNDLLNYRIKKLVNQRHVEQLKEKWFVEEKNLWSKNKQITPNWAGLDQLESTSVK